MEMDTLFFKVGWEDILDAPQSRWPSDGVNDKMVNVVRAIIQEENHSIIEQILEKMREEMLLNVSVGTVHSILHQDLEMNKVCARWVPKMLTDEHKGPITPTECSDERSKSLACH